MGFVRRKRIQGNCGIEIAAETDFQVIEVCECGKCILESGISRAAQ
jgi:hypothetical protein